MRIALVARRDLEHEGSIIPAGFRFDAAPIEAAVLCYQRKAAFAPPGMIDPVPTILLPVEEPAPDPPRRRVARRRPAREAEAVETPKPKRRYRRRDLSADQP